MRFMISARVPTEQTNALIQEGRFSQTFQSILEDLQPEAAYFTDVDGARGGYFIVNVDDPSELAAKTEPLLQGMGRRYKSTLCGRPRMCRGQCRHSSKQPRSTAEERRHPAETRFEGSRGSYQLRPYFLPYSPECVEAGFSEVSIAPFRCRALLTYKTGDIAFYT